MRISEAYEILKELNEKHPDMNLAVFHDGRFWTKGLSMVAIGHVTEAQKAARLAANTRMIEAELDAVINTKSRGNGFGGKKANSSTYDDDTPPF